MTGLLHKARRYLFGYDAVESKNRPGRDGLRRPGLAPGVGLKSFVSNIPRKNQPPSARRHRWERRLVSCWKGVPAWPRHALPKRPISGPQDRRREVVAIMARGLVRLRPAAGKDPELPPESPCSVAEDAAPCDPRVNANERVTR